MSSSLVGKLETLKAVVFSLGGYLWAFDQEHLEESKVTLRRATRGFWHGEWGRLKFPVLFWHLESLLEGRPAI